MASGQNVSGPTAAAIHASQQIQSSEFRLKGAKWLERKALRYLEHTKAVTRSIRTTREDISAVLEALRNDGTDVGRGLGLRRHHKMALVNMRASSPLQVFLALGNLAVDGDAAERVGARIAELMPVVAPEAEPAGGDVGAAGSSAAGGDGGHGRGGSGGGGERKRPRARAGSATSAASASSTGSRGGGGGGRGAGRGGGRGGLGGHGHGHGHGASSAAASAAGGR